MFSKLESERGPRSTPWRRERAVLLTGWSLLLVTALNDYVIRPRLVGRGGASHPFLMFVALLGGISVFGAVGVIIGPISCRSSWRARTFTSASAKRIEATIAAAVARRTARPRPARAGAGSRPAAMPASAHRMHDAVMRTGV